MEEGSGSQRAAESALAMKICYIGNFDNFYRTERYVSRALTELGHRVLEYPFFPSTCYHQVMFSEKPDLLLFSKPFNISFSSLISECRKRKIKTVCWLWDLFWDFPGGTRRFPPQMMLADFVFTTDGGHDRNWKSSNVNHFLLRQGIYEKEALMIPPAYKYDVGFVGVANGGKVYEERTKIIQKLSKDYGNRFVIHQNTRGLDLNRALATIRIIVGHSIRSSSYWSNRIYEILGRGGFFLHPATSGLEEEFTDGTHYASYTYGSYISLKEKIEHFLRHDKEREKIKRQGHEFCKQRYTYKIRAKKMMDTIAAAAGPNTKSGISRFSAL